jgi:hypothetical protein
MIRSAMTPSAPPAAPHKTSAAFHNTPSWEACQAWATSIAAEYAATSSAARSSGRALGPSALSALNPTSAKAAMLYALRNSTCQDNVGGDVASYTSSLVAAQNSAAAISSATAFQPHLDLAGDVL